MALSLIFLVGIATALFVRTNIDGSSTGVAFGPATGSDMLSMRQAYALMAIFVLLGGVTVGTNVVYTLESGFVPPTYFTPIASIGVKVSVSTSETAGIAVAGMGAALGALNWRTVGVVVMGWFVAPVLAFWICAFIDHYLYDDLVAQFDLESESRSTPAKVRVIAIGCYMAF